MHVGLAMPGIAAAHDCDPEPMNELARRDIAPGPRNIPFIFGLVVDDRLSPFGPPFRRSLDVPILNADVIHPWLAMVEIHRSFAVMDRFEVAIGIALFEDMEIPVPLRDRLAVEQEVVFVAERPPDVGIGRQPRLEIADIAKVSLSAHVAIAPAVVGVKDDDVGFDPEFAKRADLPFEMAEHRRIGPVEIFFSVVADNEGAMERLVGIVDIVFWKDAHADLVESRLCERL